MTGINEIMQKRLMDSIKAVPGKWKIVVVDSKSTRILTAACKMYDILEENVTVVENIEKQRQPYPTLDAVYFLTPCRESVLRLADDFTGPNGPMYKAAHIHFTSGLEDQLFTELNKKFKAAGASEYIQSLKEMYVDFMVKESSVFTVDPLSSYISIYGSDPYAKPDQALKMIAKQLLSVCATLGEDPIIRYQVTENDNPDDRRPRAPPATRQLANILQNEIDDFCRLNRNFPPPRNPPQPRATLLIVDRSLDVNAQLLHEFTYQAMINDLLPVEDTENGTGIKYSYSFNQNDGSIGTQEVFLDEDDTVYKSIRHLHIAECTDRLIEEFNKFLEENKTAVQSGDRSAPPKDSAKSLKDMKEMLGNLPQFQDMKAKYSAHLSIAQECLSIFEKHKLNSVGNLEQNIATGETPDGETPKTVVLDMVPLLDDPYVSPADKARLLMLYIVSKENGIFEDDKHKLLEHAKLKGEFRDAVNNLPSLGVQVTKQRRKGGEKSLRKKKERKRSQDETPYELSRYVPQLKKVMDAQLSNTLEPAHFAYTRQSDMDPSDDGGAPSGNPGIPQSGVSLRTTKPTWSKKPTSVPGGGQSRSSGAKLIVFVLGSLSYSEIRSAYEVAAMYNRDVYIGTTDVMRPAKFVEETGQLRLPPPSIKSLIPPYVPPSPPASKASSLLSHMPHINNSSSSHLSLSNLSIRSGGASGTSSTPDSKNVDEKADKKKKKGLKKLFG
ncbi:Sec1-like protein [Zychaea mexicana]|uniref:Sec1-like protein n=1 Tax=Zychaea mexicana TaxID=64656 RepID=UPI0022FED7CE|nr:Sec1-like protein [Zychaea mexicana]KAI9491623.1 Sec1-like protein [Zychaea mexicana]